MIELQDVTVRFGDLCALEALSLEIPKGCLFGLLGPNGAGKSTAIACVAGLRKPNSGSVLVDGIDVLKHPEEVRGLLGLVPQSLALFPELSVLDNLATFAGIFNVPKSHQKDRIDWGLELAQLTQKRAEKVAHLSGGMARRLNLACGLLHNPKIIICDEPTSGVDPQSRNHIFEMLRALHQEGRTIIYTTHYMEEVEALCGRVAIIDHGKVIACDSLSNLLRHEEHDNRFVLELQQDCSPGTMAQALRGANLEVVSLERPKRSLEDLFLDLTGHRLRDGDDSGVIS